MENLAFLSQVVFLIVLAPFFARLLKAPIVVVEIIIGLLAVSVGFLDNDNDLLKVIAKIGLFYLMFLAGLELDLERFVKFKDKLFKNVLVYFATLYGLSFLIFLVFDLSPVYIVALPIVSLGMIMALINEHGKKHAWLELVLTIGVVGEIISITALVIFESAVQHGVGFELYKNIFNLIVAMILIYYVYKAAIFALWWFPELRKIIMPEHDNMAQDIRVSIALFFILIAAMQYNGIDMVLGAFVAGVFIGNLFKHKKELPETLTSVGFGFLVPIFFIYVGTTLDLEVLFKPEILIKAFWIVVAMVAIRQVASFLAYYKHLGARDTALFSLGDSMPLTFLILIATMAHDARAITLYDYYSFVLAAMIEGVGIMVIIKIIMGKIIKNKATNKKA